MCQLRRDRIQSEVSHLNRNTLERLYQALMTSTRPDCGPGREIHSDYLIAITDALHAQDLDPTPAGQTAAERTA